MDVPVSRCSASSPMRGGRVGACRWRGRRTPARHRRPDHHPGRPLPRHRGRRHRPGRHSRRDRQPHRPRRRHPHRRPDRQLRHQVGDPPAGGPRRSPRTPNGTRACIGGHPGRPNRTWAPRHVRARHPHPHVFVHHHTERRPPRRPGRPPRHGPVPRRVSDWWPASWWQRLLHRGRKATLDMANEHRVQGAPKPTPPSALLTPPSDVED